MQLYAIVAPRDTYASLANIPRDICMAEKGLPYSGILCIYAHIPAEANESQDGNRGQFAFWDNLTKP